jgi:hypothetical protein
VALTVDQSQSCCAEPAIERFKIPSGVDRAEGDGSVTVPWALVTAVSVRLWFRYERGGSFMEPASAGLGPLDSALASGTLDWIDIAEFSGGAKAAGLDDSELIRAAALGLIAEGLCSGLFVAGSAEHSGFHQWEGTPGQAVERLVREWSSDDLYPSPGAIAWFQLTELGDERGRAALEREKARQEKDA